MAKVKWVKLEDCMFDANNFFSVYMQEVYTYDEKGHRGQAGQIAKIVLGQKGGCGHSFFTKHTIAEVQEAVSKALGLELNNDK